MPPKILMDTADGSHVHGSGTTASWKDGFRHQFSYMGKRHTVYSKTEAELKNAKRKKINALDAEAARLAAPAPKAVMTIAEWTSCWKASHAKIWTPGTVRNYDRYLNRYILPALGERTLNRLSPMVVREFVSGVPETYKDRNGVVRHFGDTSRFHLFGVISSFMNDAKVNADVSGLERNPIAEMKPPFLPSAEPPEDPWTPIEVEAFFRGCKGHYLAVPFALAGFGGLRESEILGLTWADVDFDKGLIYVQRQLDRDGTIRTRLKSKREKEARVVVLPRAWMTMLASYKARKRAQQVKAASRWKGSVDLVVTTYLGTPYSQRNFLRELDRLAKRYGLRHTDIHGLRRAANSLMKMQGVAGATRQHLMGHASLQTTERYDYTYDESIREAASALGDAFPWLTELADAG